MAADLGNPDVFVDKKVSTTGGAGHPTLWASLSFRKASPYTSSAQTEWQSQLLWWSAAFRKARDAYSAKLDPASRSSDFSPIKPDDENAPEVVSTTIESWILRNRRYKLRTWRAVLLRALQTSCSDVLLLLRHNLQHNGELFPSIVVQDCLDHLASVYLDGPASPSKTVLDILLCVACDFLHIYAQRLRSITIKPRTIRLLGKHSDTQQLLALLKTLQETHVTLHMNTKLHLMPKLVEAGKIGVALSLLKGIPTSDLSSPQVQMFCVMLLRTEVEVEDIYRFRSSVLAFMLEAGIKPNRIMADVIILNAMEGGDIDTAWRSHEIARENGLAPDVGTYTALLKGIQYGDSKDAVWRIYDSAKGDGFLVESSRLRFELLYAMYLSENGKYQSSPYTTLLPRYQEFFDIRPLQELGIYYPPRGFVDAGIRPQESAVQALGLMILAWLQQHHSTGPVREVYDRYLHHTMNNHPIIAQLAETTHTSNAFSMAFGRSAYTLHLCTQVVQDMLKPKTTKLGTLKADIGNVETTCVNEIDSGTSVSNAFVLEAEEHRYAAKDGKSMTLQDSIGSSTPKSHLGDSKVQTHEIATELPTVIVDPESAALVQWNAGNREFVVAPPDIRTWTILLFAFIKHRQATAAEKVLTIMRSRKMTPNIVTWNSLLSGYAAMQDLSGVVSTLKRMDLAGIKHDEWTAKALTSVMDRDALLTMFERSTQEG
ncbi:hypothetical protein MMC13_003963 [Lambiella insularis]|nr:hypothetical protein [Lambiella insularis]